MIKPSKLKDFYAIKVCLIQNISLLLVIQYFAFSQRHIINEIC